MAMETAFRSDERFTQAEFFEWLQSRPRGDVHHYELLGGHIVMTPPAGFPHAPIGACIVAYLHRFVSAGRLGLVNNSSAGFDLPSGDTVEPDASFLSSETLAAGPKPQPGKFYQLIPDLVVEILSRSTARRDRNEKKLIYERNGVGEYWIVSPESRHVTIYRRTDGGFGRALLIARGDVDSSVLPGLKIPLDEIFAGTD